MKNSVFPLEQLTEDPYTHTHTHSSALEFLRDLLWPHSSCATCVCSPLTCCSGTLECPVTSVTPETVTLCPEMFAMVTLLRWMYLRKTSAFRLARVHAWKGKADLELKHPFSWLRLA